MEAVLCGIFRKQDELTSSVCQGTKQGKGRIKDQGKDKGIRHGKYQSPRPRTKQGMDQDKAQGARIKGRQGQRQ